MFTRGSECRDRGQGKQYLSVSGFVVVNVTTRVTKQQTKTSKSVCGLHQLSHLSSTLLHANKGYTILLYCCYYCHYFCLFSIHPFFLSVFGLLLIFIFIMFSLFLELKGEEVK